MWESQEVEKTHGVKRVDHPEHGLLELHFQAMRLPPPDEGLTLLLHAPEPGSASQAALQALSHRARPYATTAT